MTSHIDLDENEEWVAALTADGWGPMEHAAHNWEVKAHIHTAFGQSEAILHEPLSKFVRLDIHVIVPANGRTFTTYVTSGMSDLAVKAPEGYADWRRAELVIALEGSPESHVDEAGRRHYMIEHLRNYARRPHAIGNCFILGETIDPFDPDETIGLDTRLSAHLLTRPVVTPIIDVMDAFRLNLSGGEVVNFLALTPIHADELELRKLQGPDVLIERLETAGVTELYNPNRPSVALQKTKGFSLKRLFGG